VPSNFPGGFDTFNEPSIPEETTLSSAGTATRNHPEHHRDLGDAIETIEHNVSLKGHTHAGGTGDFDTPKLDEANTHEHSDVDSASTARHHTLGTNAYQAAPGNHIHDYNGPTIINQPLLLCESTSRPFDPTVGTMIYETDTNRVRAWSTFMNNVVVTGLNSTDNFNYAPFTDSAGRLCLNPAHWEQWYADDPADTDHGAMANPDGQHVSWIEEGSDANRCIARRVLAADKETQTDDQVITWMTGGVTVEGTIPFGEGASNDKYFRMSANRQSYLHLAVGHNWVKLYYTTTGPANEKLLGSLNYVTTTTTFTQWAGQIKDRVFTLYRLGEQLGTIKDTAAVSAKGAANRGWAFGMSAGDQLLWQTSPGTIDWIRIQDLSYFQTANRWTLLSVASVPAIRLRQSKNQKILYSGSVIEWTEELEDNFGFFNPANQTDISMNEAGLYQIECAIQWDPQFVPDIASMALMINGVETTVKDQRFMRGNTFTPGFSQTLSVSGKLRCAAGDILQVKVKYTAGASLLDKIFSYFDAPTKVNSRLDIHFMSP
jgi:hypothetical protein